MASPYLYFGDGRLSTAELSAASLDGDLVALGEGWVPADTVETPALRAASLAPLLRQDAAATHFSAAWVWGGLESPPARHSVQRIAPRRTRQRVDPRYVYRDPLIATDDLSVLAGAAVTTPVRTAVDLARDEPTAAPAIIAVLERIHPGTRDGAVRWFASRGRVPGKRVALALLTAAGASVRTT